MTYEKQNLCGSKFLRKVNNKGIRTRQLNLVALFLILNRYWSMELYFLQYISIFLKELPNEKLDNFFNVIFRVHLVMKSSYNILRDVRKLRENSLVLFISFKESQCMQKINVTEHPFIMPLTWDIKIYVNPRQIMVQTLS